MPRAIASRALELELLLQRATECGVLDIDNLLETYSGLQPGSHPGLADARRVDFEGVEAAIESLPAGFFEAAQVLVVQDLRAFSYQAVASTLLPCGQLEDGRLLIEASFGMVSLATLCAPLCLLVWEAYKARDLLEGRSSTELSEATEDEGLTSNAMARMAFAWGADEASLDGANDRTDGRLVDLLLGEIALPQILLHADLDGQRARAQARSKAERVMAALAEMGLLQRPIFLWIGDEVVTDCLSPYARELRQVLLTWAAQNPDACGADIGQESQPGEDLVYAVARDFVHSDPQLARERIEADRTVGILRHPGFEVIDLGRTDPAVCDARLTLGPSSAPVAPVLIRLPQDLGDPDATGVVALLEGLAAQLAGVALVLEGAPLFSPIGTIFLPELMVRWAGEEKLAIPGGVPFEPLVGFADSAVEYGAILSVPNAGLLSTEHIAELAQRYCVSAVDVGGAATLRALADARWRGVLSANTTVQWAVVGTEVVRFRPSVATLGGQSALALSFLRGIWEMSEPQPVQNVVPEEAPTPEKKPPSPSGSFRIKA